MLAIRLQRQGRKGYATYRFIVQEASLSPNSGRVVARIGSYNPHTKEVNLDKDKAKSYLANGAQPSDAVVRIFKSEKITIPKWVETPTKQKRQTKNPDKLRKNRPKEEKPTQEEVPAEEEKPVEEKPEDDAAQQEAASEESTQEEDQSSSKESEEEPKETPQEDEEKSQDEPKSE